MGTSLPSMNVPSNIVTIDNGAFMDSLLEEIVMPATLQAIRGSAFIAHGNAYRKLTKVIIYAETPPTMSNNAFLGQNYVNIYVPDASVDTYKSAQYWSNSASKIKGLSELPS